MLFQCIVLLLTCFSFFMVYQEESVPLRLSPSLTCCTAQPVQHSSQLRVLFLATTLQSSSEVTHPGREVGSCPSHCNILFQGT